MQAAQAHAALGETDQARRLLGTAAESAAERIEPPPPVYWYSEPFFQLNIGIVQNKIGDYRDAADLLGDAPSRMPADQRDAEWLKEYKGAYARPRERA
ncbi:hypothetical protein GCM10010191_01420 [Actinomadura vinacea]|uniref:Tetratricopeptide repeat protein n=1 Tax=Actinomadura vinacea TaxID=115336 RepID=A0ABN3I9P4_9ACTN